MNKPKMILFDYGQTLAGENTFDGIAGTQAVLDFCVENPKNVSAQDIQSLANALNHDIGKYNFEARDPSLSESDSADVLSTDLALKGPSSVNLVLWEVHVHQFHKYLYEYFGIRPTVSPLELETVFWDHAAPAKLTKNILPFLSFLKNQNIQTGVISNLTFSGQALTNRLKNLFPDHDFAFILTSSEYIFRKPHKRIFEIALRKSGYRPEEVWYCGDNFICDIYGAYTCGISPVWYKGAPRGTSEVETSAPDAPGLSGHSTASVYSAPANPFYVAKENFLEIHDWNELIDLLGT